MAMANKVPRIAVVGGGLAGMMCADALKQKGFAVQVFDMGRRATGGRASSRRTQEGYFFNHGLQFLKLTDEGLLSRARDEWEPTGALQAWSGVHGGYDARTRHFTARPGGGADPPTPSAASGDAGGGFCGFLEPGDLFVANGLTEHLRAASGVPVSLGTIVKALDWQSDGGGGSGEWHLAGRDGNADAADLGTFDAVVLSDAMTARRGSPGHLLVDGAELGTIFPVMDGLEPRAVFTLMAAFPPGASGAHRPFEAAAITNSDAFQWVCMENRKPNFPAERGPWQGTDAECWVAISTFAFAAELLAAHPQQRDFKFVEQTQAYLDPIQQALWQEFESLMAPIWRESKAAVEGKEGKGKGKGSLPSPVYLKAQRWGGAFYRNPRFCPTRYFDKRPKRLVICGDCCTEEGDAQAAMLSGANAARKVASFFK